MSKITTFLILPKILSLLGLQSILLFVIYNSIFNNIYLLGCIECMRCSLLLPMIAVSVSLSVTRLNSASLCKSGWTDQNAVWSKHSWGPMKRCVRWGSWSLHRLHRERELGKFVQLWTHYRLHISGMAKATDFKFCVFIGGWGPNENCAKVGHKGSGRGHVTYFKIFGPLVSQETAEARESCTCSVCCAVHSMQLL